MKLRSADAATTWLLVTCLLLVVLNLAEWGMPLTVKIDAAARPSEVGPGGRAPVIYQHPAREHFDAILDRPVFFRDRRLPVKPETVHAEPIRPLRLKLEGVAIVASSRIAVLRSLADSRLVHLREGESHDGWELDTISSGSVSFTHGDQTTELLLDLPGSP
jgi:hypothetical protein